MEQQIDLDKGLKIVHDDYVLKIIEYLKTKKLDQSHKNYIKCYSYISFPFNHFRMVLRLCDELDKAKELNEYFKETLTTHIKKTVVPELAQLSDEVLITNFVRQWKDFTILVHYLRKMFNYLVRIMM